MSPFSFSGFEVPLSTFHFKASNSFIQLQLHLKSCDLGYNNARCLKPPCVLRSDKSDEARTRALVGPFEASFLLPPRQPYLTRFTCGFGGIARARSLLEPAGITRHLTRQKHRNTRGIISKKFNSLHRALKSGGEAAFGGASKKYNVCAMVP